MSDDVDGITCGGCFAEAWGFTSTEVREDGWVVKHCRGQPFEMCSECVQRFEESRQLDALFALPAAAPDRIQRTT